MAPRLPLLFLPAILAACASADVLYDSRDDDAAPIYLSLRKKLPKLPPVVEAAFQREPAETAEVDAAIAAFHPFLEEIARAARARRCDWTYDPPPTILSEVPVDYALSVGRVLVVRSRRRLETGDHRGSQEDLVVLLRFGSDLLQGRWTIGKLLGVIACAWAGYELQGRLAKGRLDRSQLEFLVDHLRPIIRRYPPPVSLLLDERKMAVPLLDEVRDLGLDEVVRRVGGDMAKPEDSPPIIAEWHEWLQATLRKDIEMARRKICRRWDEQMLPFEEAYTKPLNSGELDRRSAELKERGRALSDRMARRVLGVLPDGDEGYEEIADLLFRLWVPAIGKAASRFAESRVLLETMLLACTLELHRFRSGSYPQQDPEGLPTDPFVGGSIRYRRVIRPDGEGYVLAAAGPKNDAEERIRVLAEDYRFDLERFQENGDAESDTYTFGVFRRR